MVAYFCTPALAGLRQEDWEFEATFVRPCLKKQNKSGYRIKTPWLFQVRTSDEQTPRVTVGNQTQVFQKKPAS